MVLFPFNSNIININLDKINMSGYNSMIYNKLKNYLKIAFVKKKRIVKLLTEQLATIHYLYPNGDSIFLKQI